MQYEELIYCTVYSTVDRKHHSEAGNNLPCYSIFFLHAPYVFTCFRIRQPTEWFTVKFFEKTDDLIG